MAQWKNFIPGPYCAAMQKLQISIWIMELLDYETDQIDRREAALSASLCLESWKWNMIYIIRDVESTGSKLSNCCYIAHIDFCICTIYVIIWTTSVTSGLPYNVIQSNLWHMCTSPEIYMYLKRKISGLVLVGFEPTTFTTPVWCSTSWATKPLGAG